MSKQLIHKENREGPARSVKTVAAEIKAHYEDVAQKGGKIVGSHTLQYAHYSEGNGQPGDYVFLVAEFPEPQDTINPQDQIISTSS